MPKSMHDDEDDGSNDRGEFEQPPMGGVRRYQKGRVVAIRYSGSYELPPVKWNHLRLLPDAGRAYSQKLLIEEVEKMRKKMNEQDIENAAGAQTLFYDGDFVLDTSGRMQAYREGILSVVPGRGFAHIEALAQDDTASLLGKSDRVAYRVVIETPVTTIEYRLAARNPRTARVLNELFVTSLVQSGPAGIRSGIEEMEREWALTQNKEKPTPLTKIHEERLH